MVHITIFQAPFASLMERGLYLKMHDPNHTFHEQVPAEYYLVAFDGEIECPNQFLEDSEQRTTHFWNMCFLSSIPGILPDTAGAACRWVTLSGWRGSTICA